MAKKTLANPTSTNLIAGDQIGEFQSFNSALQEAYDRVALSEKRYRELYDNAPDMYHTLDLQGNFVEFNPKHTEMLGYSEQELEGTPFSRIMAARSLPRLQEGFGILMDKAHLEGYEIDLVRKDGSIMTVEVHARTFSGPDGAPKEVRCIMRDVTERKRLEEEVRQIQKMESIGQLAGGVAHDFNNLLTAMLGYAEMSLAIIPDDNPAHEYIKQVKRASERASDLTRQLLAFSRRQIIDPKAVDLNELIKNYVKMLSRLVREDITLETALAADLNAVLVDSGQIEQVLLNLVVNAKDAIPEAGRIIIETANVTLHAEDLSSHHDLKPGEYVMLVVTDTGTGMSPEIQAQVFEPFFTTKGEDKGTGLGLSTCYGIVKQHHGLISLESEVGVGTTFRVYLPRIQPGIVADWSPAEDEDLPVTGTETILLVEDDYLVRGLISRVLQGNGYKVLEATDGDEALNIAQSHDDCIHLVLTDVVMPNMNVREMTERIKATHSNAKVLYTSGYTDDAIVRHGVLEAGVEFIQKPYEPAKLLKKIRSVLDG